MGLADGMAYEKEFGDADQKVNSPTGGTKNDLGKPRDILLHKGCPLALEEAVKVMTMGAEKYGDYNWKEVEVERYHSALHRHLRAYYNNPLSVDADSKQSHLSHVLTNVLFLVQLEQEEINEPV